MSEMTMRSQYAPGSYGCHEALHMASVLRDMVEERLCEHPAIEANLLWLALAQDAQKALFDLYQAIGAVHVSPPERQQTPPPEWRPIATVPRDGRILMAVYSEAEYVIGEGYYSAELAAWAWSIDGATWPKPTHWQPLPEPPQVTT